MESRKLKCKFTRQLLKKTWSDRDLKKTEMKRNESLLSHERRISLTFALKSDKDFIPVSLHLKRIPKDCTSSWNLKTY